MSTAERVPQQRIEVGILGATGMVGQQFICQLAAHPWFKPAWLAASERSEGKAYEEAAAWRLDTPPSEEVRRMKVNACTPGKGPRLIFSALDASVAKDLEPAFAAAGHINGGVSGTFRAETRDEQSAENLRDVVRGILALGRLQAQNNPKLEAFSQSLQLTGTGTTVALTFTVPSELLDMAVEHAQDAAPKVMH